MSCQRRQELGLPGLSREDLERFTGQKVHVVPQASYTCTVVEYKPMELPKGILFLDYQYDRDSQLPITTQPRGGVAGERSGSWIEENDGDEQK